MPFANVHEPMMRAMAGAKAAYGEAYHLCGPDGVHPAGNGHVVMAYAFLRAMGLSDDEASRSLRIGIGRFTSPADIDFAAEALMSAFAETTHPIQA